MKNTGSVFRPCTLNEYALWLALWIEAGNTPTHYYDYPFTRQTWLTATQDFTTGGECGAASVNILVPVGVNHRGGDLGHNKLYFMDGPTQRGTVTVVPVFNDPVFATLPGVASFIEAKEEEARAIDRQYRAEREKDKEAMSRSDVGRWQLNERP